MTLSLCSVYVLKCSKGGPYACRPGRGSNQGQGRLKHAFSPSDSPWHASFFTHAADRLIRKLIHRAHTVTSTLTYTVKGATHKHKVRVRVHASAKEKKKKNRVQKGHFSSMPGAVCVCRRVEAGVACTFLGLNLLGLQHVCSLSMQATSDRQRSQTGCDKNTKREIKQSDKEMGWLRLAK